MQCHYAFVSELRPKSVVTYLRKQYVFVFQTDSPGATLLSPYAPQWSVDIVVQ